MVSRLAAQSVKVVLSGDGGDELFAGYDKYAVEGRERRYRALPGFARRLMRRRRAPDARRHAGPQLPAPHRAARRRPLSRRDHALPERPALVAAHARGRGAGRRRGPLEGRARPARDRSGALAVGAAVLRSPRLLAARHPDQGRPDEHGPLDRGAGAAARSQARRVRGHHPSRAADAERRAEGPVQARDARGPARGRPLAPQARLRHSPRSLAPGTAGALRPRSPAVRDEPRPGHLRPGSDPAHRGAAGARAGGSRSSALDADLDRALVPPLPGQAARGRRPPRALRALAGAA